MHSAQCTHPPPKWKLREVGGSNPPTTSRAAQDWSVESASWFAGRTAQRTPSTRKRILCPPNCHRHSRQITILSYPTHSHKHTHTQRQSVLYTNFDNKSKREREGERKRMSVFNSNPSSPDSIPTLNLEVLLYYPGGKHWNGAAIWYEGPDASGSHLVPHVVFFLSSTGVQFYFSFLFSSFNLLY